MSDGLTAEQEAEALEAVCEGLQATVEQQIARAEAAEARVAELEAALAQVVATGDLAWPARDRVLRMQRIARPSFAAPTTEAVTE